MLCYVILCYVMLYYVMFVILLASSYSCRGAVEESENLDIIRNKKNKKRRDILDIRMPDNVIQIRLVIS